MKQSRLIYRFSQASWFGKLASVFVAGYLGLAAYNLGAALWPVNGPAYHLDPFDEAAVADAQHVRIIAAGNIDSDRFVDGDGQAVLSFIARGIATRDSFELVAGSIEQGHVTYIHRSGWVNTPRIITIAGRGPAGDGELAMAIWERGTSRGFNAIPADGLFDGLGWGIIFLALDVADMADE